MKSYSVARKAFRRWLLRNLQPCREIAVVISQSKERRLTLVERLKLRLHRYVCQWCDHYARQLHFLSELTRGSEIEKVTSGMDDVAKARIAAAIRDK